MVFLDKTHAMKQILMIDDDSVLTGMLTTFLGREGLGVTACHHGRDGVRLLGQKSFALVILDLMLPDLHGLEVLREIRSTSDIPVLMLTAKGDDLDKIVGLESGADDYLPKPFNPRELVARIRSLLRRSAGAGPAATTAEPMAIDTLVIDPKARSATMADTPLPLTATEFDLLLILMQNHGSVVARDFLSRKLLGRPHDSIDRSLDVHVSNLRRKLGERGDGQEWVRTVRGKGFLFLRPSVIE